jgi:hypothetical protein
MPDFYFHGQISRPCKVRIAGVSLDFAMERAAKGEYDQLVEEYGGRLNEQFTWDEGVILDQDEKEVSA